MFCQWTFSAPANSPILKEIIDLCTHRILNEDIKGEHVVHYFTGPQVFIDAVRRYANKEHSDVNITCCDDFYSKYKYNDIKVFNRDEFHTKFIHHHHNGSSCDGWKTQRKGVLF